MLGLKDHSPLRYADCLALEVPGKSTYSLIIPSRVISLNSEVFGARESALTCKRNSVTNRQA